jgi:glucose-6-phosphate 1-dehydrogenase
MTVVAPRSPVTAARSAPVPDDHVIVLFGANGDLARRKLLPGLFHLSQTGLMPAHFRIIGASRSALSPEEFRAAARAAVDEFGRMVPDERSWEAFARCLSYVSTSEAQALGAAVHAAEQEIRQEGRPVRRLHYLSVPPAAFNGIVEMLGKLGLNRDARVILEKPFGYDLESARALNATVQRVFDESQVYRIDHFLGKEAVQNILALRFANGMFEPVWNRDHIDHIQIDIPETLSIGSRAEFYERTGAFRDMVVTHLLQVLGFVAMEPPTALTAKMLREEKEKVFDSLAPLSGGEVVRGQYEGYRREPGVAPDSQTETFVAVRAWVENWRWDGVPFFLRTGKRMAASRHMLTIAFRQPPRRMFPYDCRYIAESFGSDHLTIELGDPGSISASFLAKVPGPAMQLGEAEMRFGYADAFGGAEQLLEA